MLHLLLLHEPLELVNIRWHSVVRGFVDLSLVGVEREDVRVLWLLA